MPSITDHKQQPVNLGDIVRILKLDEDFIQSFPEDEQVLISSMVGGLFKVIALDEEGYPCVMREWHDEEGKLQSHVLALDSEEIERL